MYVNRANHEISDATYNELSPKMKAKYSKVNKPVAKKVETPKETKPKSTPAKD